MATLHDEPAVEKDLAMIEDPVEGVLHHPKGVRTGYPTTTYYWGVTRFTVNRPREGYYYGEIDCAHCGKTMGYRVPSQVLAKRRRRAFLFTTLFFALVAGGGVYLMISLSDYYQSKFLPAVFSIVVLATLVSLRTLLSTLAEQGRPGVDPDRPPVGHSFPRGTN